MWRFVLKENIRRLSTLVAQATSAREREELGRLLKDCETELEELEEASTTQEAAADASLRFLAERIVDEAVKLYGAQFSSLQIFDESREHLLILAQRNFRAPFLHYLAQMRPGDGSACGRCLSDNAPATIEDVHSDPEFEPHREAAREAGFEAVHATPVRDGTGNLIAVLSTYFGAPKSFSEDDLYRMTYFADSIGINLEKHLRR